MKIDDLSHCSRPMCFENKMEGFEYSLKGSCFVIRYLRRLYAVTAKHVLKGFDYKQAIIPYELGSEWFLPISTYLAVNTDEEEDTDHRDIIVFELAEDQFERDLRKQTIYDLDTEASSLPSRSMLMVHGFPSELNQADYDEQYLDFQRFSYSAEYFGKMPFLGVHEMVFNCDCPLQSLDGMSGGAVFWVVNLGDLKAKAGLAGIMLRGTVESGQGYFLDIRVAKELIRLHHKQMKY